MPACLPESTFPIQDIMSKSRYGDMQAFVDKLKAQGYEEVNLIPTDDGKFMTKTEGKRLGLTGSTLLEGKNRTFFNSKLAMPNYKSYNDHSRRCRCQRNSL